MWLFTVDGFFSAVQDRDDPERIIVRGRVREDLERLVERLSPTAGLADPEIVATPMADYAFRVFVDRSVWAGYVSAAAWKIDYPNFKARAAHGPGRFDAYHAVWATLSRWQRALVLDGEYRAEQLRVDEDQLQARLFEEGLW